MLINEYLYVAYYLIFLNIENLVNKFNLFKGIIILNF